MYNTALVTERESRNKTPVKRTPAESQVRVSTNFCVQDTAHSAFMEHLLSILTNPVEEGMVLVLPSDEGPDGQRLESFPERQAHI